MNGVEASLVAQSINKVSIAELTVLIAIEHDVVSHAQVYAGVSIQLGWSGHLEGVVLDGGSAKSFGLRASGGHVC